MLMCSLDVQRSSDMNAFVVLPPLLCVLLLGLGFVGFC